MGGNPLPVTCMTYLLMLNLAKIFKYTLHMRLNFYSIVIEIQILTESSLGDYGLWVESLTIRIPTTLNWDGHYSPIQNQNIVADSN